MFRIKKYPYMLDCIDILHNCIVLCVHHKHWINSCNTVDNLIAYVPATINRLICSNNRLACFFFIFFSQIEQAQHSIKTAAHELCWNMRIKSHTGDFFTMSFIKFISLFHCSKIPAKMNSFNKQLFHELILTKILFHLHQHLQGYV